MTGLAWPTSRAVHVSTLLGVCCFNVVLKTRVLSFHGPTTSDTFSYIESTEFLLGVPHADPWAFRLVKPLPQLGIAALSFLTGDLLDAFFVEVVAFYLALAVLAYFFFERFFDARGKAFLAALLYLTGYPVMYYGLDFLPETGGWFFYLLALMGIRLYQEAPAPPRLVLTAVAIAVGLLWKEYSGMAAVLFAITVLSHPVLSWRDRVGALLGFAAIVVVIWVPWQVVMYRRFGFSYLGWFSLEFGRTGSYDAWHVGKGLAGALALAWLPVVAGLGFWSQLPEATRALLRNFALASCTLLLSFSGSSRSYYVIAPLLLVLAVTGLERIAERARWVAAALAVAVVAFNYLWLLTADRLRPRLDQLFGF